ncbi:hypothetical protein JXR93_14390 [bacterium]|nr:hypothetical protein [bacterium]
MDIEKKIWIKQSILKIVNSLENNLEIDECEEYDKLFNIIKSELISYTKNLDDKTIDEYLKLVYELNKNSLKETIFINKDRESIEKIDGGFVIAESKPSRFEIIYFLKHFNSNLTRKVLVKYIRGYNELFLDSKNETITDNYFVDMSDFEATYKNGIKISELYRFKLNIAYLEQTESIEIL